MPTDEERIAALERELAELKTRTGKRPLSLAEIRRLSPEEAQKRWDEIKRSLGDDGRENDHDDDRQRDGKPRPLERISRGLAETARQRASTEEDDDDRS